MAPSNTSTLTIQPWTQETTSNNTITDVLNRAQRGHLRDITESSLQEEIVAEGALYLSDESGAEDEEDDQDAETASKKKGPVIGKPSTREDLYRVKHAMIQAIELARQEVDVARDLMSLVVSKDKPQEARATMGAVVKERIPAGTIGVDFWQRMPVDQARDAQDALLAANVKMDSLQNSADSLLGAAKKMEENVRRETQYWDQILSISSRGWNVCRVPGEQHKLGVRFGFSESAPQFSRKGIVALNPDSDGGFRLERGIGSKPKALQAVLRRTGEIVGASSLPAVQEAEETTLEARVRHARDSLFDEELYHEMIRESRIMTSLGVAVEGSSIHLRNVSADAEVDNLEVSFDLISLDEDSSLSSGSNEQTGLAHATMLAARLLLSQAHRDRLRKRSEPPPPLSEKQKDDSPILPILRPLMSLMLHQSAFEQLKSYLTSTSRTLTTAGITHQFTPPSLPFDFTQNDNKTQQASTSTITSADTLLTGTLLRPLTSTAKIILLDQTFALTLATQASTPTFTLHCTSTSTSTNTTTSQPHEKIFHFPDVPTFASATNSLIASSLAASLLPHVQNEAKEWKVLHNEAVVERDVGIGEVEQSFTVELNGLGGRLELTFQGREAKTLTWSAASTDQDNEGREGFVEAAVGCLT